MKKPSPASALSELGISADDLHYFNEGRLWTAYNLLGPQWLDIKKGQVRFAVWAPNASRVSIVGDFVGWDYPGLALTRLDTSGVWVGVTEGCKPGQFYKLAMSGPDGVPLPLKIDPYGRRFDLRPGTATQLHSPEAYPWGDANWMAARQTADWRHAPMSIYELHVGSWMRHPDGRLYSYRELAERLIPYVLEYGFTHIELLPITEHPLPASWGYQTTGFFGACSRYGTLDDLKFLIDACHQAGLGVLLDWTPAHFPLDEWALSWFDGTALYEHANPLQGLHPDWGTAVFNYGRHEVRSFLLSCAHYWLQEFHFDGLRVDAVASMLELDYSRPAGQWVPNEYGGRENLEAVRFLQDLNIMTHEAFPGTVTIAEESTSWPMVSRPVYLGGLGFSMKWNLGWMHDTLDYMKLDPIYRRSNHDKLTFSRSYAFSENFVLPLSHDEVVHGKASLLNKMPGDLWQQAANRRLLEVHRMTWPGKKLLFMGGEFGQRQEWSEERELDWPLLEHKDHQGLQRLVCDMNRVYRDVSALHDLDFEPDGFQWIDCHDVDHSTLSYLRYARDGSFVAVILNYTPLVRSCYRIGVPLVGPYQEIFNSDSVYYGGSNQGNLGTLIATAEPWMGKPASLTMTLPPLSGVILQMQNPTPASDQKQVRE